MVITRRNSTIDAQTLARTRRFLLVTLIAGVAGMGVELELIGHVEDVVQFVPIALLPVGLAAVQGMPPGHRGRPGTTQEDAS